MINRSRRNRSEASPGHLDGGGYVRAESCASRRMVFCLHFDCGRAFHGLLGTVSAYIPPSGHCCHEVRSNIKRHRAGVGCGRWSQRAGLLGAFSGARYNNIFRFLPDEEVTSDQCLCIDEFGRKWRSFFHSHSPAIPGYDALDSGDDVFRNSSRLTWNATRRAFEDGSKSTPGQSLGAQTLMGPETETEGRPTMTSTSPALGDRRLPRVLLILIIMTTAGCRA